MIEERKCICVLCGQEWGVKNPLATHCENEKCSGYLTWGYKLDEPECYYIDEELNWHLNTTDENKQL